jgi:hypothetical protein
MNKFITDSEQDKKSFIPVGSAPILSPIFFFSWFGNVRLHFVCFVLFCTELVGFAHQVLAVLDSSVSGYLMLST